MSKSRPATDAAPAKPAADAKPAAPATAEKPPKKKESSRETIESVVVAFILAFLFRTFEAEAFVIPTGSMAPTLEGRHKDVVCPKCGYEYTFGASEEMENADGPYVSANRIRHAACPNCRYVTDVKDLPVFKGDRILVNKFAYEFASPERWDVVVFKYPEDPKTNYIKRLVGLPGETLEIRQGDVYSHHDGGEEILRKADPYKQKMLQLLVYDNDYPERPLLEKGWPERWIGMKRGTAEAEVAAGNISGWSVDSEGWQVDSEARTYKLGAGTLKDGLRWLRYRHILPTDDDWSAATASPPRELRKDPQPQLITDFCGYNSYTQWGGIEDGLYWVGDLTINARVQVASADPQATLLLELIEGNRRYRARFELDTGRVALLMHDDLARGDSEEDEQLLATGESRLKGTGTWNVAFANVDDRLCLWVDNQLVEFDKPTDYLPYGGRKIQRPWNEDVVPVGIAAQGAEVVVSKLFLERDIYYRGDYIRPNDFNREISYREYQGNEFTLRKAATRPEEWGEIYEKHWLGNDPEVKPDQYLFELGADEFFMMGDNSPRSKDSRLWPQMFRGLESLHRHAVHRNALVGKAFFIYWPHGVPFLNDGRGFPDGQNSIFNNGITRSWFYHVERDDNRPGALRVSEDYYPSFRVPFYPNVGRMERIR